MGSFLAFGEILFDCFADHNVLGGAPLNVTYHAASLGLDARIVSAVGNDSLGDEALAEISAKGIDSSLVAVLGGIPTGRADITMVGKNADYEFNCPAAWDAALRSGRKAYILRCEYQEEFLFAGNHRA